MALLETEALVLRTYNLAEADKIVVCLTKGAGLIRAVARGSRRLKNRYGAALEPFTLLNVSCYQKEHQELISLRQVEILKSNFNLLCDADMLTALAYMGDLVIEFSPPYQPNEKLFRMLKACLETLAQSPSDIQAVLRYFEVWLLKLEGFLPDLNRCGECHSVIGDAATVYLGAELMLRCQNCYAGIGYPLSKKVHAQLRATHKMAPTVFAAESRSASARTRKEMAELTHQMIGRVLERQPRIRLNFSMGTS
jgi:DNA repair protein RecO (recombination protein O)